MPMIHIEIRRHVKGRGRLVAVAVVDAAGEFADDCHRGGGGDGFFEGREGEEGGCQDGDGTDVGVEGERFAEDAEGGLGGWRGE